MPAKPNKHRNMVCEQHYRTASLPLPCLVGAASGVFFCVGVSLFACFVAGGGVSVVPVAGLAPVMGLVG